MIEFPPIPNKDGFAWLIELTVPPSGGGVRGDDLTIAELGMSTAPRATVFFADTGLIALTYTPYNGKACTIKASETLPEDLSTNESPIVVAISVVSAENDSTRIALFVNGRKQASDTLRHTKFQAFSGEIAIASRLDGSHHIGRTYLRRMITWGGRISDSEIEKTSKEILSGSFRDIAGQKK